ncbi:hypothetical protein MRX96_045947 [Rhipicephalus microplus]
MQTPAPKNSLKGAFRYPTLPRSCTGTTPRRRAQLIWHGVGKPKGFVPDSSKRRGSRCKKHRRNPSSCMHVASGFRSHRQHRFERQVRPSRRTTMLACASSSSQLISPMLCDGSLSRSLRRSSTAVKDWPAKMPRPSRGLAHRNWFVKASLWSPLKPGRCKTSQGHILRKAISSSRTPCVCLEMAWRSGSHSAGDISKMTWNAECAGKSGRFASCPSNAIKRRTRSGWRKPTRLSRVPGRLQAVRRHGHYHPFLATTSVSFHQGRHVSSGVDDAVTNFSDRVFHRLQLQTKR